LPTTRFPRRSRSANLFLNKAFPRVKRNEPVARTTGSQTTGKPSQHPWDIFEREENAIGVEDPMLKPVSLYLPKDMLEAGFSGKEVSRILSVGEGEMITGVAPFPILRKEGR